MAHKHIDVTHKHISILIQLVRHTNCQSVTDVCRYHATADALGWQLACHTMECRPQIAYVNHTTRTVKHKDVYWCEHCCPEYGRQPAAFAPEGLGQPGGGAVLVYNCSPCIASPCLAPVNICDCTSTT
eukprot:351121-Chlamydomonas_euryale.AAC.6